MSTPTSPNSADRALAAVHDLVNDLHRKWVTDRDNDGTYTLELNPKQTRLFFDETTQWFIAHRSSAVAEAVAGLEKELAKADWMLAAVDLNRSGWAPSFIDEVTEGACKGPHKGPAELLVEACNTVDSTRKALTTAESDRDSLAALVVRMREEIANARKGMSAGYYPGDPEDILDKALSLVPASLADCVVVKRAPFKLGDDVECCSGGEWITGFKFIGYIPEWSAPYIVKGDTNPSGFYYPLRAHKECRAALRPEAKGGA